MALPAEEVRQAAPAPEDREAAPSAVVLDDWAYWRRPSRRAPSAKRTGPDEQSRPRVQVVPRQGFFVRDGGRAASLPQPATWRATTASASGI